MKDREEFFLQRDPITGEPFREEPTQLPLSPKQKTEGVFTRNAEALIRRHGGKVNDR